jgi:uncharacterized UPF0146 family protein
VESGDAKKGSVASSVLEHGRVSVRAEGRNRPGLLGWRARRRYRFVLRCVKPTAGARVIDVGGAQGIFASMLLAAGAAEVTVVEPKERHYADGTRLHRDPRLHFVHDDVFARLELLAEAELVTALHCLHQLGPAVHELFEAIAASPVKTVVLQGSISHHSRVEPVHERELWGPALGLPAGMRGLLEAHGFRARLHPHRRYPVAVGVR